MFTDDQREMLQAPLNPGRIEQRKIKGKDMSYLETWDCIDTANRIFGFDGWSSEVKELQRMDPLGWLATVRVTVGNVSREDVGEVNYAIPAADRVRLETGAATFDQVLKGETLETAVKGAVSDALKRALRSFGNQFGNDLYDKDRGTSAPAVAPPAPEVPATPREDFSEWLAHIMAMQPSEFDDLKTELIQKNASTSQRKALIDLADSRGVEFNKESGWFFWAVEGKV